MSALYLKRVSMRKALGLKGPSSSAWLGQQRITIPIRPNSWAWSESDAAGSPPVMVARLGASEFFIESRSESATLERLEQALDTYPSGTYAVLRRDWCFEFGGAGIHDVWAQVCNVDLASVPATSREVIMTVAIGVSVLVVPNGNEGDPHYRLWCDPTFGHYFDENMGAIVSECGGNFLGVSA